MEVPSDQGEEEVNARGFANCPPLLKIFVKIIKFEAMVSITFWALAAHIFGLFTNEQHNTRRSSAAVIDFDGGIFGSSLLDVAKLVNRSDGHLTYHILDPNSISPSEIKEQVFSGKYWVAFYCKEAASARFEAAINGTAHAYEPTETIVFTLLGGRYFQVFAESLLTGIETIAQMTSARISTNAVLPILQEGQYSKSSVSTSALSLPVRVLQIEAGIHPFNMDDKPLINSVGTALFTLMCIFPSIASHHIVRHAQLYKRTSTSGLYCLRNLVSIEWSVIAALSATGWTFAFKGSYFIDAKMFFAFWAVSWIYSMITFDLFTFVLIVAPTPLIPLLAVSWVICSVTATLGPPSILDQWYRVNYFFPSFHWWQTVMTVLMQGAIDHLDYSLPTLASWLILTKLLLFVATGQEVNKRKS